MQILTAATRDISSPMHRGANKSEEDVNTTTADPVNNIDGDEDELEQPLIPGWMLKYYLEKKTFISTFQTCILNLQNSQLNDISLTKSKRSFYEQKATFS